MRRRWFWMPVAALVALSSCGGDAMGPTYPAPSGTYATMFTLNFSNAVETLSQPQSGTMTLSSADGSGAFTGSYVITGGGSGTVAGVLRADGGLSISHFGDPAADPVQSAQFVRNVFYWCDFDRAGSMSLSGSLSGRTVSFSGSVTLPCAYTNGFTSTSYSSSITVSVRDSR